MNFPPDYTAIALLAAVFTAVGTSAKIKVKSKWYEFPSLYAAIVGPSGINKSHPLNLVFDIFNKIDTNNIREYQKLYNEFEEYQSLNKKEKKDKQKLNKPILIKSILHDFTTEILLQRLSENHIGCAIVSGKSGGLDHPNPISVDQKGNW